MQPLLLKNSPHLEKLFHVSFVPFCFNDFRIATDYRYTAYYCRTTDFRIFIDTCVVKNLRISENCVITVFISIKNQLQMLSEE